MIKGLIIREPWITEILKGRKTWELRSRSFSFRGEIALIRQDSGEVSGIAELIDCLSPLDREAMLNSYNKHRVSPDLVDEVLAKGWTIPWALTNVRELPETVPYRHSPGAVITVNLDTETERRIRNQLTSTRPARSGRLEPYPTPAPLALQLMSGDERALAFAALPHLAGEIRPINNRVGSRKSKDWVKFITEFGDVPGDGPREGRAHC